MSTGTLEFLSHRSFLETHTHTPICSWEKNWGLTTESGDLFGCHGACWWGLAQGPSGDITTLPSSMIKLTTFQSQAQSFNCWATRSKIIKQYHSMDSEQIILLCFAPLPWKHSRSELLMAANANRKFNEDWLEDWEHCYWPKTINGLEVPWCECNSNETALGKHWKVLCRRRSVRCSC